MQLMIDIIGVVAKPKLTVLPLNISSYEKGEMKAASQNHAWRWQLGNCAGRSEIDVDFR